MKTMEINVRAVYSFWSIVIGHAPLTTLRGFLNLPPPMGKNAYDGLNSIKWRWKACPIQVHPYKWQSKACPMLPLDYVQPRKLQMLEFLQIVRGRENWSRQHLG